MMGSLPCPCEQQGLVYWYDTGDPYCTLLTGPHRIGERSNSSDARGVAFFGATCW